VAVTALLQALVDLCSEVGQAFLAVPVIDYDVMPGVCALGIQAVGGWEARPALGFAAALLLLL